LDSSLQGYEANFKTHGVMTQKAHGVMTQRTHGVMTQQTHGVMTQKAQSKPLLP
jgi:hypothetical protein